MGYPTLNAGADETFSDIVLRDPYCWGYQFGYDAWGNLLYQQGWAPNYTGCSEPTMSPVTADGNNHISAFAYDASGNASSDGAFAYTWDAESQMKTAAGVTYTYDGDGRRVMKSNGKIYWYGSGGEILAETDAAGNTLNEYIFFGGQRIAMLPSGSSPLYYVEDFLGTSRVITSNTGVVCYDADFDPFGGEHAYTNTCPLNYKFEGKERDSETGNDDFGARYYSNRYGRWLSADWSAVPVPVPYANLTNPQTLNLYAMVSDDPESFADLDGHSDYIWQKIKNSLSGHGWKTDAQVKGWTVAQTARNHDGSMDWAVNGRNTSGKDAGHPQDFKPGQDKCNEFVGDTLAEAGKTRPEVPDGKGGMRMATSHELADPSVHIPGLSDPKPLSEAKPGDVIAQQHGDWGHTGIVVGPGQTASANTAENNGGKITLNSWGFRPPGQNGENPKKDPPPVVRHPQDPQ